MRFSIMFRTQSLYLCKRGQSLTEYLLAGGLIGMVALAGLFLLGGNLAGVMASLKADLQSEGPMAAQAGGGGNDVGGGGAALASSVSMDMGNGVFMLSDGTVIDLRNDPGAISKVMDTLGANGTTSVLASAIEEMARQMVADGELDQADANAFVDLANKGHHLARLQELVQNAVVEADGDWAKFENATATYNGQTYKMQDLYQDLRFWQDGTNTPLRDFRESYWDVHNQISGNKAAQDLLASFSLPLSEISLDVSDGVDALIRGEGDVQSTAAFLGSGEAPVETDENSEGICNTGNRQDTGTHCN